MPSLVRIKRRNVTTNGSWQIVKTVNIQVVTANGNSGLTTKVPIQVATSTDSQEYTWQYSVEGYLYSASSSNGYRRAYFNLNESRIHIYTV